MMSSYICKVLEYDPDTYYHKTVSLRTHDPVKVILIGQLCLGGANSERTFKFDHTYNGGWNRGAFYIPERHLEILHVVHDVILAMDLLRAMNKRCRSYLTYTPPKKQCSTCGWIQIFAMSKYRFLCHGHANKPVIKATNIEELKNASIKCRWKNKADVNLITIKLLTEGT